MDSKPSKSERTRQFIIESTAGVFNTKGFAGTSMADLTGATGLTKGSIYGNFLNKEEVALAVFDFNCQNVFGSIRQEMDKADTYFDKLMVYARMYEFYSRTFPEGGCPILNTAVEADDTNSLLKTRSATAILEWQKGITGLLSAGVKSGEFKPGINQAQLALSIIALVEGGIMIARATGDMANLDTVLKTVATLLKDIRN